MGANHRSNPVETKRRLLDAAEILFIQRGYENMSLRQVTTNANTNLAAVNYHFGSKEVLVHGVLSRRLTRLNHERLALLSAVEAESDTALDCKLLLTILFAPALRISRDAQWGGPAFLRLLGRIYSDSSRFVQSYLQEHYRPIYERFFAAFERALPQLSRNELGLRLHFALKALSGMIAGDDLSQLISELSMGQSYDEAQVLNRLVALLAATLIAPFGDAAQVERTRHVLIQADAVAISTDQRLAAKEAVDAKPPVGLPPLWKHEAW